jgi:hypothetical protein
LTGYQLSVGAPILLGEKGGDLLHDSLGALFDHFGLEATALR